MINSHRSARMRWAIWIAERVLALSLSFLLLRSAFAHLGNLFFFLSTVYSYNLVHAFAGKLIALIVPHAELVLGTALVLGLGKRASYLLTSLLFALFASAQLLVLAQDLKIPCGCYGASESLEIGSLTVAIALGGSLASLIGAALTHLEALSC